MGIDFLLTEMNGNLADGIEIFSGWDLLQPSRYRIFSFRADSLSTLLIEDKYDEMAFVLAHFLCSL